LLSIFLSEVSTPEPAWLLVHDSEDGELVEILGATYVGEGIHENVPIFMKVPEDGTMDELFVVMHSDKGELGVLDELDLPVEDVDPRRFKLHDSLSIVKESEEEEAGRILKSEDFPYYPIYYVR
jgi:hypothetical protein